MRKMAVLGWGFVTMVLAGCISRPDIAPGEITILDNVGGSARPTWRMDPGKVARIEVESRVEDCSLQDFRVTPSRTPETRQGNGRVEFPDGIQEGRAVLHILVSGESSIVMARYTHTVLVEEGSRSEPQEGSEASGSGQIRVGRILSNDYRFDHFDFSTQVTGPGGASARVTEAFLPGSDSAYLTIRWNYDRYSKVFFSWKTYAIGPCHLSP